MTDAAKGSLIMDVRPGDRLAVGPDVQIEIIEKSGKLARIRIAAPKEIEIKRLPGFVPGMAQS